METNSFPKEQVISAFPNHKIKIEWIRFGSVTTGPRPNIPITMIRLQGLYTYFEILGTSDSLGVK